MMTEEVIPKEKLLTMRMIHLAMVGAGVIYAMVIVMINMSAPMAPIVVDESTLMMMDVAVVVVGFMLALLIPKIRFKLLDSDNMLKETPNNGQNGPVFLPKYMTMLFILWALCDILMIGGIVVFLLSAKMLLPMVAIGFGSLLLFFNGPKIKELEVLASRLATVQHQG